MSKKKKVGKHREEETSAYNEVRECRHCCYVDAGTEQEEEEKEGAREVKEVRWDRCSE